MSLESVDTSRMGAKYIPDPTEESREAVVAGLLCPRCRKYSAFTAGDARLCKHCGHDEAARLRNAKLAANSLHVPGTKHMSDGVARKLAMNKKYYESREADIRSGALQLDIPRGAPDAPDLPKKIF